MKTRAQHWAQINEISFIAGMRLLFWIFRLFGRWPFRLSLYPVLMCYLITQRQARAASKNYLEHVRTFAKTTETTETTAIKANGWGVLRHFASFAETILDKMLLWNGQLNLDHPQCHGHHTLRADLERQRGGLLICAHLGNMDLYRVLSKQRYDLKLTVLIHTKHAQAFNRLLAKLNPNSQLNLMQVTEISPATAIVLMEKISQGEFVVIAGDRIPVKSNARVAFASFLGQSAPFPVGPYVLASLLQCSVYLIFAIRTAAGAELHIEPFRESILLPRKKREQLLTELVGDYAKRLEHYCLRAPRQWFNFYDFWQIPERKITHAPR